VNRPVTLVEPGTVKLERLLPGPLERVWAYVTEPAKRAKWLCGGELELRVGGKVRMEFNHDNLSSEKTPPEKRRSKDEMGQHAGVVTRLEPPRLLTHTWTWNGGNTEVTYELAPRGKEVLLTIVHRRLEGRDITVGVMGGWDTHTGILADVLHGVEPRPFWTTHNKLQQEYGQLL